MAFEQVVGQPFLHLQVITTQGTLKNASQGTIKYAYKHDWEGYVSQQSLYPPSIQNAADGKFAHGGKIGSVAAVVYRGKDFDWVLAWSCNIWSPFANKVYTEIAEPGSPMYWDWIKKKLDEGQNSAKCQWNGYHASLTIGQGTIGQGISANLEGTKNIVLSNPTAQQGGHETVTTRGTLKNASQGIINRADKQDWKGSVSRKTPYPASIQNAASGKFAHVGKSGSIAAVVYRGCDFDWVVAWRCHQSLPFNNKVYTKIDQIGTTWNWDMIKKELDEGKSYADFEWKDYYATVTIGPGISPNIAAEISFIDEEVRAALASSRN